MEVSGADLLTGPRAGQPGLPRSRPASDGHRSRLLPIPVLHLALLGLLALASHIGSLGNGLVFDDDQAISENDMVQGPLRPLELLGRDFWGRLPGQGPGTWRPLPVLSFWLDRWLGRGSVWLFHLGNLLWHSLAVMAFAIALASRGVHRSTALVAGASFALFAVNSEAVDWLVGRADIMAASFCFLAWFLTAPSAVRGLRLRIALASAAFAAALLCKESAAIFPLWLVLSDWILGSSGPGAAARSKSRTRSRTACYIAMAGVAVAYLLARTLLFSSPVAVSRSTNNNILLEQSFGVRALTGLKLFLLTLRLMLFPLNLSPDYSYAEIMPAFHPGSVEVLAGGLALLLLLLGAWCLRRREPQISTAIVLTLVTWTAISNIPVALPTIFAERLLYLPTAGLALAFGRGLELAWTSGRPRLALLMAFVVLPANLARSAVRDQDWKDDISLFSAAVQVCPRSARVWNNLGSALQSKGLHPEAMAALERALHIAPQWSAPHTFMGVSLDLTGRHEEAEQHLRRAVELDPRLVVSSYNLGLYLARRGRRQEAAAVLRALLARRPDQPREIRLLESIEEDLANRPVLDLWWDGSEGDGARPRPDPVSGEP